jgi:LysM domain
MSVQMTLSTQSRAADVGRGLLSLVGAAALVVGVPVALLAWVGSPLPAEMPSLSEVTSALRDTYIPDEFLVKALALVCWLVWVELVASLLVEAVAHVRGRKAGNVPLSGGLQRGAARLVAGVALLGVLFATRGMQHDDGSNPLRPVAQPAITLVSDLDTAAPGPGAVPAADAVVAPAPTYEVQRRDTLWDIAERHLGDPFRWREIFQLNEGVPQADGRCLTDPDLIAPGWQLRLPGDASGLAPTPVPAPAPAPDTVPPAHDAPPESSVVVEGGMVLIDDDGGSGGGAVLVSETPGASASAVAAGSAPGADGMVLLPDVARGGGPSDGVGSSEPLLAGPDESGDDASGSDDADEMAAPAGPTAVGPRPTQGD